MDSLYGLNFPEMQCGIKRRQLLLWSVSCIVLVFIVSSVLVILIQCRDVNVVFLRQRKQDKAIVNTMRDPPDNVTKVVILSYMRSGTTLMGKLFDEDESALYIFEPMWYLCIVASPGYKLLRYLNGTKRYAPRSCTSLATAEMEDYLSCKITQINTGSLTQVWMQSAKKTDRFYRCGLSNDCVVNFTRECKSSKLRVVKVLHLPIDGVLPLLRRDPNLKVIHLVRDPRAQIQSRIPLKEFYYYSPTITASEICGSMLRNVRALRQARDEFPKQLLQVRYEDFASTPMEFTEKIFDFIGVPLPNKVKTWVKVNTEAQANDGILGTKRSNSRLSSQRWRERIPWGLMIGIDEVCGRVYQELGYYVTDSESVLRNLSIPLMRTGKTRW